MIDYCVAAFAKDEEERVYRAYLTDALQAISHNTAGMAAEGHVMTRRFAELVNWVEEDTRTGDEVAADVIKRAGLKYGRI